MTNEEFSNEFDVLYNSITSNQAPGLDEYEKSVFLTKAQSEILREYFNPRVDGANGGFDGSPKRQYDFSFLINHVVLDKGSSTTIFDKRAKDFYFPSDYFLSINELISITSASNTIKYYSVIPISYSEYQRLMAKPYAYPPKNNVWRLFVGTNKDNNGEVRPVAEIIGKVDWLSQNIIYSLRYVKKPKPIILTTLDGLTIDDKSTETPCELPSQLHQEILERAVTLAKIAYQGGSTATLATQTNNKQQ